MKRVRPRTSSLLWTCTLFVVFSLQWCALQLPSGGARWVGHRRCAVERLKMHPLGLILDRPDQPELAVGAAPAGSTRRRGVVVV